MSGETGVRESPVAPERPQPPARHGAPSRVDLPSGTVTFLFTDLEGSTKLLNAHPEAYRLAVLHHHALLLAAVEAHGGAVFETVGDAVYAAFWRPTDAVAAALEGQLALHREDWGEVPLRVRVGLHTGEAELRWAGQGGHYFGAPLYRCARLMATAHGGQTVLSQATAELARDALPEGAALADLGEHRLKDLFRPERVWQLVHPELPREFPPLRSLDARPHNLPLQPTPFIGRDKELATVRERLLDPGVRLLTLTGPGGTGKTRLALQAAADLLDDREALPDGAFFVDLAPLADPADVPGAVARPLGVREVPGRALAESLTEYLREKRLLLVLDNFEQVLGAGPAVADLLAACAGLKVLATSREPLRLKAEREHPVPPLRVPDPKRLPGLERLTQYEAVALFIQQAQAVKPEFAVTNENAPAVAELCHRLDGLPLAVELAAARVKVLPPELLLQRLGDVGSRLRTLTGGRRDAPARQQTLRAAIDWSYHLLDAGERTLFARLAVFAGGCTLEAAEAVCVPGGAPARDLEADPDVDVLDGLASLVDKSLLRQLEGAAGEDAPRFRMLETIREFALQKLEQAGGAEDVRRRHAEFFASLVERATAALMGPKQPASLARLEAEHDNVRAALRWVMDSAHAELALRLATMYRFWYQRSHFSEARAWLEEALTVTEGVQTPARARLLCNTGEIAMHQGDYPRASELFHASQALDQRLDKTGRASRVLPQLGHLAAAQRDYERAQEIYETGLADARKRGGRIDITLHNLGWLAVLQSDPERGRTLLEESAAEARRRGADSLVAFDLIWLAWAAVEAGDAERAAGHLKESWTLLGEVADRRQLVDWFAAIGAVATARGQARNGARLFGAAEALAAALGLALEAERPLYERHEAAARAQLGEAEFGAARRAGGGLAVEEAVREALDVAEGTQS